MKTRAEAEAELVQAKAELLAEKGTSRKAQEALQARLQLTERRAQMLAATLSGLHDFAYTFDREGRFLFANQPLLDLWGLTLEAAVGRNFLELGYPDELAAKLQRQIQEVFETKQNVVDETPYTNPEGLEGRYEYILSPALAADGTVDFVAGSTRDVTARQQAEEAIQRQQAELRILFDLVPAMICFKDTENRILRVNQRLADATGMPVEGIEGKLTHEVFPEDADRYYADDLAVIRSRAPSVGIVETIRDEHGRDHWFQTDRVPYCDVAGEVIGIVTMTLDITARQRAEDELRESKRFAESIAESTTSFIYLFDLETRRNVYANRNITEALGYSREQLDTLGDHFLATIIHPEDWPRMGQHLAHFAEVADDGVIDFEYRAKHAAGDWRWIWTRETVFNRRPNGAAWQIMGTALDITERKRAEQALGESEFRYRSLFENMLEGYAHCRMVRAEGGCQDFIYLEVNGAFATLTGLQNVVGKTIGEVIPGARESDPELFDMYRRVALTGQPERCETFFKSLGIWFSISVYSHEKEHFVAVFDNITERKLAAEALWLSEERLRAALSASGTGTFRWDIRTNALSWDDSLDALFGMRSEGTVHSLETFIAAVHPDDRADVIERCERCAREGADFAMEFRVVWPNGELHWLHDQGKTFFDAAGQPHYMTGACVDITERKWMEETLRRQQTELQVLFDLIPALVWFKDTENNFLRANQRVVEATGKPIEEIEGKSAGEIYPEQAAGYYTDDLEVIRSGTPKLGIVEQLRGPDDRELWIQTDKVPYHDTNGEVIGIVVMAHDITERKLAEEALRTSEAEFRILAEALPQIVWVTRADGWVTYFNHHWTEYTGLSLEESLGSTWVNALHPEDQPRAWEAWQHATATADVYAVEYRLRRQDGAYRWWLARGVPHLDASGDVLKWFGTCTDIHAMKVAELEISAAKREIEQLNTDLEMRVAQRTQALAAATAEAERANQAKSEFLSRMSHELRTPMNAILGFAQVLEIDEGLTGDQRESVEHILKGGSHLLGLINEVLDLSSIEAGQLSLSSEPVALARLLEESVALLRPLSAQLGLRIIVIDDDAAGGYVRADRQRLKQVLLNLLGNALKYNRPAGSVTVRCADIAGQPARKRISVSDTGAGLGAAKLARLFSPFERLGAEQTRVEGTGLGLVLARRMVEYMGGTLGVESVLGEGSTFWIELPTAEAPAEEETAAGDDDARFPVPEIFAEARVLLYVEDNPSNVRLVKRILARRPAILLLCAETGARGLEMARKHRPDLILLDLHLPDSHGDEMLSRLTADPRTGAIPVVMLTADATMDKRSEMLVAGARAFITKPLDVRNFLGVIDHFLGLPAGKAG